MSELSFTMVTAANTVVFCVVANGAAKPTDEDIRGVMEVHLQSVLKLFGEQKIESLFLRYSTEELGVLASKLKDTPGVHVGGEANEERMRFAALISLAVFALKDPNRVGATFATAWEKVLGETTCYVQPLCSAGNLTVLALCAGQSTSAKARPWWKFW